MQTFLPYASDFRMTADVLDYRRLGKQRVEAWQILTTLDGQSHGWANHPAVRMWRGYEPALCMYGIAMCEEWIARGYQDTLLPRFRAYLANTGVYVPSLDSWEWDEWDGLPPWIDDTDLYRSHRSNLIRKDFDYYGPVWPSESDDLPYYWPV